MPKTRQTIIYAGDKNPSVFTLACYGLGHTPLQIGLIEIYRALLDFGEHPYRIPISFFFHLGVTMSLSAKSLSRSGD